LNDILPTPKMSNMRSRDLSNAKEKLNGVGWFLPPYVSSGNQLIDSHCSDSPTFHHRCQLSPRDGPGYPEPLPMWSFQFYADNRLIPAVFGQMEIARGQVSDCDGVPKMRILLDLGDVHSLIPRGTKTRAGQQEQCSPEEFKAYRLAVAKIMAEMLLEVMNPLYAQHPSIKPLELE
jgi:hypothetical protein